VTARIARFRQPRIPEKVEQANGVALLRSLGGRAWVLGTRRRRGDHQGTMQTPGIPDVWAFLPPPRYKSPLDGKMPASPKGCGLWWEAKAEDGRRSPMQELFANCCADCDVAYVVGTLDDLFKFLIDGGWLLADNVAYYRREHMKG